jgi:hypothetical protein
MQDLIYIDGIRFRVVPYLLTTSFDAAAFEDDSTFGGTAADEGSLGDDEGSAGPDADHSDLDYLDGPSPEAQEITIEETPEHMILDRPWLLDDVEDIQIYKRMHDVFFVAPVTWVSLTVYLLRAF